MFRERRKVAMRQSTRLGWSFLSSIDKHIGYDYRQFNQKGRSAWNWRRPTFLRPRGSYFLGRGDWAVAGAPHIPRQTGDLRAVAAAKQSSSLRIVTYIARAETLGNQHVRQQSRGVCPSIAMLPICTQDSHVLNRVSAGRPMISSPSMPAANNFHRHSYFWVQLPKPRSN